MKKNLRYPRHHEVVMKFTFGNKVIYLRLKFDVFDINDYQIALDSGKAHKGSHYILLDYDTLWPGDFLHILMDNKLKRGLILESSPGKYHAVSFSPTPYEKMVEIMRKSNCDSRQLSVTIKRGFSGMRVTPKKGFNIRIAKELNNRDGGTNFYNYLAEKAYLEEIQRDKDGN